MATPQERIGERLVGAAAEKTLDGVFKIVESLDKKFDIILQAFLDAGLLIPPAPRKPGT